VAHADTIQAEYPNHLFGYVIRGTAAKLAQDDAALAQAYVDYREHYDAEMNAGRTRPFWSRFARRRPEPVNEAGLFYIGG
jgi:hypothetical protein